MREIRILENNNEYQVECIEKPKTRYKTCKNLDEVCDFIRDELK